MTDDPVPGTPPIDRTSALPPVPGTPPVDPRPEAAPPLPGTPPIAPASEAPAADRRPRPILERVGLAFIALVLAALFGAVAAAAWVGGELFLAAMGAIGCAMTLWVGGLTLFRG